MLLFLQAFFVAALIPIFELQAQMSARINRLSEIDELLAEKSESLSRSCWSIQRLNQELRVLEKSCIAAAKSPVATTPIIFRAKTIFAQQEWTRWKMQTEVSAPSTLLKGYWIDPTRDLSKPCLGGGELHWAGSLVAHFESESGGAKIWEKGMCKWRYVDDRVRPL